VDLHFRRPDLRDLESARGEALSFGIYLDERPLRGLAGLVDWRLCGRLSDLIVRGRFDGECGERLLVPSHGRLAFEKIFVHGLGPREGVGVDRAKDVVDTMLTTLARADARSSVLVLPGAGLPFHTQVMSHLLEVAENYPELDEICLVETTEDQRALTSMVEGQRRRVRALASRDEF